MMKSETTDFLTEIDLADDSTTTSMSGIPRLFEESEQAPSAKSASKIIIPKSQTEENVDNLNLKTPKEVGGMDTATTTEDLVEPSPPSFPKNHDSNIRETSVFTMKWAVWLTWLLCFYGLSGMLDWYLASYFTPKNEALAAANLTTEPLFETHLSLFSTCIESKNNLTHFELTNSTTPFFADFFIPSLGMARSFRHCTSYSSLPDFVDATKGISWGTSRIIALVSWAVGMICIEVLLSTLLCRFYWVVVRKHSSENKHPRLRKLLKTFTLSVIAVLVMATVIFVLTMTISHEWLKYYLFPNAVSNEQYYKASSANFTIVESILVSKRDRNSIGLTNGFFCGVLTLILTLYLSATAIWKIREMDD